MKEEAEGEEEEEKEEEAEEEKGSGRAMQRRSRKNDSGVTKWKRRGGQGGRRRGIARLS